MRPAFDDGMLSDRSRMMLLYCTPLDPPESDHIGPDVAANVVDVGVVGATATVAAVTVAVAALAAVAYHPAKKVKK